MRNYFITCNESTTYYIPGSEIAPSNCNLTNFFLEVHEIATFIIFDGIVHCPH